MLILASASPRRHEILNAAGLTHKVLAVPVNETRHPFENPADYVVRVAEQKARAVESGTDVVLAADTTVCLNDDIFGKPKGSEDAQRMLRALSGREHWVYTGICLLKGQKCIKDLSRTRVTFFELSEDELQEYTRSGEPYDKTGGYAIQGLASKFVAGIEGCYQNVVGLPVSMVYQHLKSL